MKPNKELSVLLSVLLCVSMALTPVGVLADETPAPSEEQTTEATEKPETKETEKPTVKETKKPEPEETKKPEPTEKTVESTEKTEPEVKEKETEPTEGKIPEATEEKTPEPAGTKTDKPTEETIPETAKGSETKAPANSKEITVEGKLPEKRVKKSAKNAVTGKCGDNVSWTFENGTLTISGTGFIWAERSDDDDLGKCLHNTTNCVIESGITSIGIWSFKGCEKLTSITIPNTVTSIDDDAFSGCINLKDIILPDSLTEIGQSAFYDCKSLTSIKIPNSVAYVGWFAFLGCEKLKTVTISKELYDDIVTYNWGIGSAARFDDEKSIKFIFSTQAANPLAVKGKTATVKYKKLRKKNKTLSVSKVIAFTKKGQGKLTYAKVSGNKKILINKTTGKITVKKKIKKKTYKVKVRIKAAGNEQYKPSGWKTVTFKIKVK